MALLMLCVPFAIFILMMKIHHEYVIAYLLILIVPSSIQFFGAPIIKLLGVHKYLSPMLLVNSASDEKYEIHNGTTFDYLMVMNNVKSGPEFSKKMLVYYLDGLLKIVEKIETNKLPENVLIQGSSYFFNDRTAKKLGFKLSKTNVAIKINMLVNYLDLIWMYSLSQGRLTFPNVINMQTASVTGKHLIMNKAKLNDLSLFLSRTDKKISS
jgi:hypothetical protein